MSAEGLLMEQMLLQTYFDIIPFNIYVVDVRDYSIQFVNKQMTAQFGKVDRSRPCYEALYQESAPCSHCKMKFLVDADGAPNNQMFAYEHYNELHERWYQMHEKSIAWPDGRTVKYTIGVDISELKQTQNRLAEAHAELALKNKEMKNQNDILQENVRLREDIEHMTRHDLKGPLSPILSVPESLMEDYPGLPGDVTDGLKMVFQAGSRMLGMINRSMDLVRLERGTYELAPEAFDLGVLLRNAAADLESLASSHKVTVNIAVDGKDGEGTMPIFAEKLLCYSLFSNLLQNAVEASPPGEEVAVGARLEGGTDIVVRIANKGDVPDAVRTRFFDKYSTAGKKRGTGLGTYSARLIARVHGGEVDLDSSACGSTQLVVRLPRKTGA